MAQWLNASKNKQAKKITKGTFLLAVDSIFPRTFLISSNFLIHDLQS